ncbi:hypothetical protein [Streptomyces sp. DW26H14]|uniref:hypothetical protein n=1 Tax=Streptomyces sp. DW26H14 TaxID=3435395 RepID=UPI00403E0D25
MPAPPPWPDVEQLLGEWLRSRPALAGVRVANEVPADLTGALPLLVVRIVPGGGDDHVTDSAAVDVETFAADRSGMWSLAELARRQLLAAGGVAGDPRIDTVDTAARPGEVPYGNPEVRRAIATFTVTCRARTAA